MVKFIDDLRERIVAELTEVFDKRVSAVELLVRDVRTNSREHAGHIRRLENRLADLKATNGNHHDKLLDAMKALGEFIHLFLGHYAS